MQNCSKDLLCAINSKFHSSDANFSSKVLYSPRVKTSTRGEESTFARVEKLWRIERALWQKENNIM